MLHNKYKYVNNIIYYYNFFLCTDYFACSDYPLGKSVGCFNLDVFNSPGKIIHSLKNNIDAHRCFYICNERGYKYSAISEYVHVHHNITCNIVMTELKKKLFHCTHCDNMNNIFVEIAASAAITNQILERKRCKMNV